MNIILIFVIYVFIYYFLFAGTIDVHEMIEIVGNLYEMEGVSKVSLALLWSNLYTCGQDTASERATAAFQLLDVDSDGTLTEDEFVEGCLKDKNLANLLNSGTPQCTDRRLSKAGD